MKKNLLILLMVIGSQIQAQVINNIYSVPANPTTADFVSILVDCQLTASSCNTHTQGHFFNTPTDIGAWALHCLSGVPPACNYTDTFSLGMLAAGNYTFTFQLDEGFGLPTCTPGIAPGPNDNYSFTVSLPTSTSKIEGGEFSVYPNPAGGALNIKAGELRIETIEIYSALGEKVASKRTANTGGELAIDISELSPGVYFAQLKTENKSFGKMFCVQR